MHENREISWTSWLIEQDRSAKAINRTADMHVQEKSDYAVVPMNQPNKEGQPSAEVGEGRARTVENVAESNTSPTQSGERVSHGLGDVREAAQERGYFAPRFCCALRRHLSTVRAVCVDAHVRICAGGGQ